MLASDNLEGFKLHRSHDFKFGRVRESQIDALSNSTNRNRYSKSSGLSQPVTAEPRSLAQEETGKPNTEKMHMILSAVF